MSKELTKEEISDLLTKKDDFKLKWENSVNEISKLKASKLEILNHIKSGFEVQSDYSTQCNGYKYLCREIEELKASKSEANEADILLNTFGQYCTLNGIKLTDSNKVGQAVIDFLKTRKNK